MATTLAVFVGYFFVAPKTKSLGLIIIAVFCFGAIRIHDYFSPIPIDSKITQFTGSFFCKYFVSTCEELEHSLGGSPTRTADKNDEQILRQAEVETWLNAEKSGSLYGYQAYLQRFPFGMYSKIAQTRIVEIESRAEKEIARLADERREIVAAAKREDAAWLEANRLGTAEAYQGFIKDFPKSVYFQSAQLKLASLREQDKPKRATDEKYLARKADDDTWSIAIREATIEAYRKYLQQFPTGAYAVEATSRIATLETNSGAAGSPISLEPRPTASRQPTVKCFTFNGKQVCQ